MHSICVDVNMLFMRITLELIIRYGCMVLRETTYALLNRHSNNHGIPKYSLLVTEMAPSAFL